MPAQETDEVKKLEEKVKKALLPPDLQEKADELLERISRMARTTGFTSEFEQVAHYIDWIVNLPWSKRSPDILDLKNRSLATTGLSMAIMHNILGLDLNIAPKVQLCAMVSEFGKIPFFIYRQKKDQDQVVQEIMSEEFINIHHGRFGLKMIRQFDLPDFLADLFNKKSLIFFDREHEFSITTVVRIAKLLVRDSFKHHGKLVITSVVDDSCQVVFGSVGSELITFFESLGIGHLLEVIPFETPAQEYARKKKIKNESR